MLGEEVQLLVISGEKMECGGSGTILEETGESVATGAGSFLRTEDVGRALLGDVLRDVKDWMIRDWIRTITPPFSRRRSRRCNVLKIGTSE